jgi:hypothetical protein
VEEDYHAKQKLADIPSSMMSKPLLACVDHDDLAAQATVGDACLDESARSKGLAACAPMKLQDAFPQEPCSIDFEGATWSQTIAKPQKFNRITMGEAVFHGNKVLKFGNRSEGKRAEDLMQQHEPERPDFDGLEGQPQSETLTIPHEQTACVSADSFRSRFPDQDYETIAASLDSLPKLPSDTLLPTPLPMLGSLPIRDDAKPKHLCLECGKAFKRAHNLKIHGRLHSGDKPYGCPFAHCDKEFRWKSSIVSHLNWHKTKMGELLLGFDGTAAGYDVHSQKKKGVASTQERLEYRTEHKSCFASDENAAKSRLKQALLLQSHADARQTEALRAADVAIAAAKEAAEEAANAAAASEIIEAAALHWSKAHTSKLWSSPTPQQISPPSISSGSDDVACGDTANMVRPCSSLQSSSANLHLPTQASVVRLPDKGSDVLDTCMEESPAAGVKSECLVLQSAIPDCSKTDTHYEFFAF